MRYRRFRAAGSRGDITVLLSIPNIEEALGVWHSEPATARKRLQIVRDLAGFGSLLKQPSDLFADVIRAYAASGPEPSPLLARQQRLHFASVLDKIADGGGATYSGLITRILADVKALKEAFKASMSEGRAQSLTELTAQGYTRQDLRTMSFEGYFTRGAEEWAAGLADGIGAGAPWRERGLDGLLAIRTVRLGVGVAMSLVHAQICDDRAPDFGDGYDLWHTILASTADAFVTREQRLHDHVARVPGVSGFRVVKSLAAALGGT
jgi:hypothetical protein